MLWWLRVVPLLLLLTPGLDGSGSGSTGNSADDGSVESEDPPKSAPPVEEDDEVEDEDELDELGDVEKKVAGTDFEAGFKAMLEKHGQGSARRLAEILYRTNYQLRESNRLLRTEIAQLQATKPRKGAMTLAKAEAEAYRTYRALGTPDEIKQRLSTGVEAAKELTTRRRQDALREVADIAGYDYRALKDSAVGNQTFSIKTIDENGTQVRRAFVVTRDGDTTKESPISDYVDANYPHLLPALTAQSAVPQRQGFVRQPGPAPQRSNQQQQKPAQTVLSAYDDAPKPS